MNSGIAKIDEIINKKFSYHVLTIYIIKMHMHTHTYIYIYIYIYMFSYKTGNKLIRIWKKQK